jgi:integrase
MDMSRFESWLRSRNYRTSTIRQTLTQARTGYALWLADPDAAIPDGTRPGLRRAATYLETMGEAPDFARWLEEQGIVGGMRPMAAKPTGRKLEARAFSEADYRTICAACEQPARQADPEVHVLRVLARTGLRVGDVLRVPLDNLQQGLEGAAEGGPGVLPIERKGGSWVQIPILGALDAWSELYDRAASFDNVAGYVSGGVSHSPESGDIPYTRTRRYFEALCANEGVAGRAHLHRLRRTVAVRALRATDGDLIGVQQLLGHKSIASTQRYVDEIDAERVAAIQRKIR